MDTLSRYICIGLPKSGTTSLEVALRNLGKVVHADPYNVSVAHAFQRANFAVFDLPGMQEVNVFSEIPAAGFYSDILRIYPDSGVIHLVREKEAWIESCRRWWGRFSTMDLEIYDTLKDEEMSYLERRALGFFQIALFGTFLFDADRFSQIYDEHMGKAQSIFKGDARYLRISLEDEDEHKAGLVSEFIGQTLDTFPRSNVGTR